MLRVLHDLGHGAALHHAPGVHHRYAVGHFAGDAHVVGDKDDRHAEFALQLTQEQEDLDLHCGIQRRGRFVGEQQLGRTGEGQCDHRALAHAAGHLVRVGIQPALGVGDLHAFQHLQRPGAAGGLVDAAVADHRLGDLVADREHRVEREHRLLEDHRHDAATVVLELPSGERQGVATVDADRPADLRPFGRQDAQQRAQRHALAAARLADHAQHLTRRQVEVHAVHGMDRLAAVGERDGEVADGDEGFGHAYTFGAFVCQSVACW